MEQVGRVNYAEIPYSSHLGHALVEGEGQVVDGLGVVLTHDVYLLKVFYLRCFVDVNKTYAA